LLEAPVILVGDPGSALWGVIRLLSNKLLTHLRELLTSNGAPGMTALVGHPGSFCWGPRYALGGVHEKRKLLLEAPVAGPPAVMQEMASEGLSLRRIAKD
jgi:hypothetical protein